MPTKTDNLLKEIKKWCDTKRGRRSELAKVAGTTRQAITDWLAHRRVPTLEQGLAIQEFLKKQR